MVRTLMQVDDISPSTETKLDISWMTNLTPEQVIAGLQLYTDLAYQMDFLTPTARKRLGEALTSMSHSLNRFKMAKLIDEHQLSKAQVYPPKMEGDE